MGEGPNQETLLKNTVPARESRESFERYTYGLIDPRPIPEAKTANERLFENPHGVLGIEVTIPEYAQRCTLGNIDPQHTDGNVDLAAIEVAKTFDVLPEGTSMVTARADLDALGAMAVLNYRARGGAINPDMDSRITEVAVADKFANGLWPGKAALPTKENPWPTSGESTSGERLAAISLCAADFKTPLDERVATVGSFLTEGIEPADYREKAEAERTDIVAALESGKIHIEVVEDGKIAFVESSHRAGTMLGYSQAPVVVAYNPQFRQGPGEPYKKYTICQYDESWVDLATVKNELAKMEEGWGGSPTIIGSPQGKSSGITKEQVIEVVRRYLKELPNQI